MSDIAERRKNKEKKEDRESIQSRSNAAGISDRQNIVPG
jgi:hypothetical protein